MPRGTVDAFAASYSVDGHHVWSLACENLSLEEAVANAVALADNDELLISGRFQDAINFGGPGDVLDGSEFSRFLVRLAPDGTYLDSAAFDGRASERSTLLVNADNEIMVSDDRTRYDWFGEFGVIDRTLTLTSTFSAHSRMSFGAVDGFGRAVVAGRITGRIDFTPDQSGGEFGEDGETSGYVAKLSWDGTFHSGTDRPQGVNCIAADPQGDGSYYIVGKATSTMSLGLTPIVPAGAADGYLAKLSNNHEPLWAVHLPSSSRSDATACALDPRGNLIVGGSFDGDVRLSPTGQVHEATAGTFVAKYDGTTGEQLWETVGTGDADVQALATDSVGRAVAAFQVKTEPITVDGETYPGSAETNMLLLQFAP